MKKEWVRPSATIQQFEADEYVATCFYIACEYGGTTINLNGYNQKHTKLDNGSGCGHAKNQAISVLNGDIQTGATISITELNCRDWLGNPVADKSCYFVGSEFATDPRENTISNVKVGDTIYWVTNVGYWMPHRGTITYSDTERPNHP